MKTLFSAAAAIALAWTVVRCADDKAEKDDEQAAKPASKVDEPASDIHAICKDAQNQLISRKNGRQPRAGAVLDAPERLVVSSAQQPTPAIPERSGSPAEGGPGLPNLFRIRDVDSETHMEYHQVTIPRGKEVVLADLKGPGKVTYWYITDDTRGKWYPGLVLKVYWDEEKEPSINVPLSDFFGAMGGRTIDYQSIPLKIQHLCYMCYLPMPFAKSARFVLANDGDRDYSQRVAYGIDYERDPQYAGEKSRLHCAWHRSNPVKDGLHTILHVKGRGHYVGNFLQVYTKSKHWWGEGDTIFDVNGRKITHSPGTEDEYGACWAFGNTYSYLESGYLENQSGNNRMYRWYLTNPVRFRESLKVEIQNQHKNGTPTTDDADDYTSIAFWYQDGTHPTALQIFAERTATTKAGAGKKED